MIIRLLVWSLVVVASMSAFGRGSDLLQLSLPDARTLSIGRVSAELISRESRSTSQSILLDANVKLHLTHAESAKHVFASAIFKTSPPLFVVVTREPSTTRRGMGFCSAGFEDYLLLLEVGANKIVLRDQLLLQSCLKSIALACDSGDDPLEALKINPVTQEIFFQTLGQEEDKVSVEDGKFRVLNAAAK